MLEKNDSINNYKDLKSQAPYDFTDENIKK